MQGGRCMVQLHGKGQKSGWFRRRQGGVQCIQRRRAGRLRRCGTTLGQQGQPREGGHVAQTCHHLPIGGSGHQPVPAGLRHRQQVPGQIATVDR